jgi:hypothetical protein
VGGNATLECLAKGMLITINRKKYYLNWKKNIIFTNKN